MSALSGWPTTTQSPAPYACLFDALATGTPARMITTVVGDGLSGRTTDDGYDIPTRRVYTWIVLGRDAVQQTIDRTEDGGGITTETCTGLTESTTGSVPEGTGCSPS